MPIELRKRPLHHPRGHELQGGSNEAGQRGAMQRTPRSSALDNKAPSKMASFTFTWTHHGSSAYACLESGNVTGGLRGARSQPDGSGWSRDPTEAHVEPHAARRGGGGWLGGSLLCSLRPTLYLGRVGGCLLGVISQALGGPFQTPKYLLHLLPAIAVPDKSIFLFLS